MRLHGIDRDVWKRYTDPGATWRYDVVAPGYKYNLTDLAAAIGRVQLKKVETLLLQRRNVARRYLAAFRGLDFLQVPPQSENHAWHLFIIRINEAKLSIDRDAFIEELGKKGIGVSVHFIPLHLMSYYRDKYSLKPDDFPAALQCFRSCISLPLSASLTEQEVERVISAVVEVGETCHR
jgi:dTDP-4-amino-4,6-dideoxygalactose transaminase